MLSAYYNPIVYGTPTTPGFDYLIGKNWTVTEKVRTGFVRGNLDHELSSSVTLRGNVGVQYVYTDQSSDATYKDDATGVVLPCTDGKTYDDVLPTINLAFMLPNQQAVRVGLARELARARMDQLKSSSEFSYASSTGMPGGSGGNPQLDPWRANAFDLSYEKYFGTNAYLSVAGFYKDLKTYIYNQTNANYDFSAYVATLPPNYFAPGVVPQTTGNFSQPVNGSGGNLKGLELALSLTGELFTTALSGFGAILSIARRRAASRSRIRRATTSSRATASARFRCRVCRRRCGTPRCTTRTRLLGARRDSRALEVHRRGHQLCERSRVQVRKGRHDHRCADRV